MADEPQPVSNEDLSPAAASLLDEAVAELRTLNGDRPDERYVRESFFDLAPLADGEYVEGYWVNEPFAYVTIRFNAKTREWRYHVLEPTLSAAETFVRRDVERAVRNTWRDRSTPDDEEGFTEEALKTVIDEHAAELEPGPRCKLEYYLSRDFTGYGPIDPMMHDPNLEDISCDGYGVPLFVYHQRYRDLSTNRSFEVPYLDDLVIRLAQRAGDYLSVASPRGGGMLPDGSRIQLTLGTEISDRGSNFTIRRFSEVPFTPLDLIGTNTFSVEQMAYLWLAIENNMSILFVGPTASGKTTSLNAASLFLPPNRKVVSVEQVRELVIPHDNWIASVTRDTTGGGRDAIGMYDLLQDALHQRPEYLLVGEIRTDPEVVRTFFHSIFTGHPGGTTFHAKDAGSAVDRLLSDPLSVPPRMINAIDIVSVQRQVLLDDHRVRRNYAISEVRMEDDLEVVPLFEWDPYTDSFDHADDLYGDSSVLRDVAENRGWDELDINEELYRRRIYLQYLIEDGHTDYEEVSAALHLFSRDRSHALELLSDDRLDPSELDGPSHG